jgi:hypothetical protein
VDPIDTGPVGGRFETFDANARFVIVRDDEGYGVWRLDDLEDGEPIERFSDDDRGYEAAASRWKELTAVGRRDVWLGRLKWIVVASGAVWALASIIQAVLIPIEYGMSGGPFRGGGDFLNDLFTYLQAGITAGSAMTVAGLAAYVVLWLESRRER